MSRFYVVIISKKVKFLHSYNSGRKLSKSEVQKYGLTPYTKACYKTNWSNKCFLTNNIIREVFLQY